MVGAFDVDLRVVGDAKLPEQAGERHAFDRYFFNRGGIASGPVGVQAAPVIVLQIDVEFCLTGSIRNREIQQFQTSIADFIPEALARSFAKRRIGFERDHLEAAPEVERGVFAIIHAEIENDPALFCITRHPRAFLSCGIA